MFQTGGTPHETTVTGPGHHAESASPSSVPSASHDVAKPRDGVWVKRRLEHLHECEWGTPASLGFTDHGPFGRNHKFLTPANIAAALIWRKTCVK